MMAPSSVDFPAPLGPITLTIWPGRTSIDTSCSASTLPYRTQSPDTDKIGAVVVSVISIHSAEIGFDHRRVVLHLFGQAMCDARAELHDDEPIREIHHEVHVVLDQQYAHALRLELT